MEELRHLLTTTYSSSQQAVRQDAEAQLKQMSYDTYSYLGTMKQLLLSEVPLEVKQSAVMHLQSTVKEGGNYGETLKMLTEVVLGASRVSELITHLLISILTLSSDRCLYKHQLSIGIQHLDVSLSQIELTVVLLNSLEPAFSMTAELTATVVRTLDTLMTSYDFALHLSMTRGLQSCIDRLECLHAELLCDIARTPKVVEFLAWVVVSDSSIYHQTPRMIARLKTSAISALTTLLNHNVDAVKPVTVFLLPDLAASLAAVQVELSAYDSDDQTEMRKLVSDSLQFLHSSLKSSVQAEFFSENSQHLVDHVVGWLVLTDAEIEHFHHAPLEFTSLANQVCDQCDFFSLKVSAAALLNCVCEELEGAACYLVDKLCRLLAEAIPAPEGIGKELKLDVALMTICAVSSELSLRPELMTKVDKALIADLEELLATPSDIVKSRLCLLIDKLNSSLLCSNPTHYDELLEFLTNQLDSPCRTVRLQASSALFTVISDPLCMARIEHVLSDVGSLLVDQVARSKEKDTLDALQDYILNYGEFIVGDCTRLVEALVKRVSGEGVNILVTKCFNLLLCVCEKYCADWSVNCS
jgi:hypothetical protein